MRTHPAIAVAAAILVAVGAFFRVWHLSSVPGVSGDEGWWGIQALAWLHGTPYEATTTSGNPIDLFLLIPVSLVHAVASPSFAALRAIPVLANLLALPVAFVMIRKIYGTPTAALHTVALAVLPTAIAHSRICQDPSQTVFWTGPVVYFSLMALTQRGVWIPLGLAFAIFPIALWTHPTNVFISPFLLLPIAAALRPMLPQSTRARVVVAVAAFVLLVGAATGGLLALRALAGWNEYVHKPWFSMAAERMTDGALWFEFAANNARLFNGVTIYHYFSGARPWTVPFDVVFVVCVVAALAGFVRAPGRSHAAADFGLLAACAGTWLLFYAFAGPDALRPHFERWGLCLLVPGCLVIARGTAHWIETASRVRWVPIGAAGAVAGALLVSFYANYFAEFAATGGRSHLTYVTARVEPKRQALDEVLRRSDTQRTTIVASQYWLERPLRYLASTHPNLEVVREFPADVSGGLFAVEFIGTPEFGRALAWMQARDLAVDLVTIDAADGRPLIGVLQAVAGRR